MQPEKKKLGGLIKGELYRLALEKVLMYTLYCCCFVEMDTTSTLIVLENDIT